MKRSGVTLIELLSAIFVISVPMVVWQFVAAEYGNWWGIVSAFAVGSLNFGVVVQFFRWSCRRETRLLKEAREAYRDIYRVIALPTNPELVVLPEGAKIRVGDYGWEAGPPSDDGLIYLQGLTLDWTVVWHAGLRRNEIERIGTKPNSQYDTWYPYQPPPPPCPFPVVERATMTVGRPHHSHQYWAEPSMYRPRPAARDDTDGGSD